MKKFLSLLTVLASLTALTFAADKSADSKSTSASSTADDYPLKTCVVSGEPLGSMGEFVTYTHREPGKPDRVVRFCCEGCIEDFRQNPEKFLKKLDAAKAGPASKKSGKKKSS